MIGPHYMCINWWGQRPPREDPGNSLSPSVLKSQHSMHECCTSHLLCPSYPGKLGGSAKQASPTTPCFQAAVHFYDCSSSWSCFDVHVSSAAHKCGGMGCALSSVPVMNELHLTMWEENRSLPLFNSLLPPSKLDPPFPEHLGLGPNWTLSSCSCWYHHPQLTLMSKRAPYRTQTLSTQNKTRRK